MTAPTYSEYYDGPSGDLVLECPDGKQSRVKTFKLRAAAEVFDDMLQPDTGGSGDKSADGSRSLSCRTSRAMWASSCTTCCVPLRQQYHLPA